MSSLARFFVFFFSLSLLHVRSQAGFSSELIPWDSPKSPFYDPSLTQFDRVNAWICHSIALHKQISTQTESSTMTAADGGYLMSVNIGDPPVNIMAVADTGSYLIWTQCLPYVNYYPQRGPIYNPSGSASYETVPCDDERLCSFVPCGECGLNSTCQYTIAYADGSKSVGVLSRDDISVGGSDDDNEIAYGCSHSTIGNFGEAIAGIVGAWWGSIVACVSIGQGCP